MANYRVYFCHKRKLLWLINHKVASRSILHALCPDCPLYVQPDVSNDMLLMDRYFRFMCVRNPWDRLVSHYNNLVSHPIQHIDPYERIFNVSPLDNLLFAQFLETICSTPDNKANPHFRSQHLCLPPLKPAAHLIFKFERLTDDWKLLQDRFDVPDLSYQNVCPHKHYKHYYTPELVDMVAVRFKQDVEVFDYDFERG